jgi:predicted transcriptional regulator of viral defense system
MTEFEAFLQTHAVFTLRQFRELVGRRATPASTRARIKYHLGRGRLRLVEKGLYAVAPPGAEAKRFTPDRFLVAAALRDDAVLAYHSALELLGHAHSVYRDTLYLTARRRKDLRLGDGALDYKADRLEHLNGVVELLGRPGWIAPTRTGEGSASVCQAGNLFG